MKNKRPIHITRPTLEPFSAYARLFRKSIKSGALTTDSHVREFEERTARYLGVKHCVAVSSCTAGLMLVLKGLDLKGEVILPSFTFAASGHPLTGNNLKPVFADIDPKTYTLYAKSVEKLITKKTSAILVTHIFGLPCDSKKLEPGGISVGNFGDAKVFSLSPIKVLTAAEGGLVTTNTDALAQFVRLGRNYGDDGTNNTLFAGLSARMSEFHAAIGLRSLKKLPQNLKNRRAKAAYLAAALRSIEPELIFQKVPAGYRRTYYIFSVRIDPKKLGYTRDELHDFLAARGIRSRRYFSPPLHMQPTYKAFAPKKGLLTATDTVSHTVLALPLYSHITVW